MSKKHTQGEGSGGQEPLEQSRVLVVGFLTGGVITFLFLSICASMLILAFPSFLTALHIPSTPQQCPPCPLCPSSSPSVPASTPVLTAECPACPSSPPPACPAPVCSACPSAYRDVDHHAADIDAYFAPRAVPVRGLFSVEECQQIIQAASKLKLHTALIMKDTLTSAPDAMDDDPDQRRSKHTGLDRTDERFAWIYKRLFDAINKHNKAYWQHPLPSTMASPLVEDIQFAVYEEEIKGMYSWHQDVGVMGSIAKRKLSITVQLDAPDSYEGGNLQLTGNHEAIDMPRDQGCAVVFPSYMLHQVTPVTKGVRHSLVMWLQTVDP